MSRNIKDALLEKSVALPAAGETTFVAFDLGQVDGDALEGVVVEVEVPATTTLVASKKLTFGLDTSDDNGHGEPYEGYGANGYFDEQTAKPFVVGKTGNGSFAKTFRWRLPLECLQWLQVGCVAESGAGDNTATSFTARLLV